MIKKIIFFSAVFLAVFQLSLAQNASLVSADLDRYSLRSSENKISVEVKNNGNEEITSLKLNWNDGKDHNAVVRTSIAAGQTAVVEHPVPVKYNSIVEKTINIGILNVNGVQDFDATDNTTVVKMNTILKEAKKVVFVEKGTGTWCPQCPGGIAAVDYMSKNYPDTFAAVAIHNGDPMKNQAYLNKTGINAFPTGNIDRVLKKKNFIGIKNIVPYYNQRIKVKAPADLSAEITADGAKIEIKTKTAFYSDFRSAKFTLSVILTEDNVTGTSSGYAQKNSFSGKGGDWGGYEKKPNPVPARDMVYGHVGRAVIGGYSGTKGSIPAEISAGDVIEYTFNHTLPKEETKNYNLIILLIDTSNGSVVNAKEINIEKALSVGDLDLTYSSLKMYPNPVSEKLNISFKALKDNYTVTLYDMTGRVVLTEKHTNFAVGSEQNVALSVSSLTPGSYIATIANNDASYSQVVIVE